MRKLASFLPLGMRRQVLASHLSNFVGSDKVRHHLRIVEDGAPEGGELAVGLERRNGDIWVRVKPRVLSNRHPYRLTYSRLPPVLQIFSAARTSVERVTVELADGVTVAPGALCFSSSRDDVLLVPDVYFVNSDGFRWAREAATSAPPWAERDDRIVWRGRPTGIGVVAADPMNVANQRLRQRVRMCLALRNADGVDAKLVKITLHAFKSSAERRTLAEHGISGRKIRERSWARRKYAMDIDGNTNSWSNFYIRLLFGCCVIKVASPGPFRQWYYDALEPWVHFVPVRADMADLIEKIDWCRGHADQCRGIAAAGQAFAMSRTVESEMVDAVARLEAAEERAGSLFKLSVSY